MALRETFLPLSLADLPAVASERKRDGWRFVQMLCVNTEDGIDLVYSFMKDGLLENLEIKGVQNGTPVPSVTNEFLAAFVFENEAHDLFGVDVRDMAIDFEGSFYTLAAKEPMTVISPAQKAAREKARKAAVAKAAKEAKAALADESADAARELEARLASMDPAKAEKVRAAAAAKEARKADDAAAARAATIASLDPEKAAKLKAALEAKEAREAAKGADGAEARGETSATGISSSASAESAAKEGEGV